LPGNRVSMVWSTWDDAAQRLLVLDAADLEREVEVATEQVLGQMRLLNNALAFPLRLARPDELIKPRLALIGDAAHSVHPLAGQGVNLGFQDARELAAILRNRGAQDDCGDWQLLRRYARARKEAIVSMQFVTDALQRLFNNDAPALKWLRNTGLSMTDRAAPLKKMLVEHALG
jgi:2-octaprenylphenol hydroxylase